MEIEEVKNFLLEKEKDLKQIVVSDKLNGEINKIIVKPIKIKDKLIYQVATFKNNQVFHNNLDYKSAIFSLQIENFKQILCENVGSNTIFSISKNGYKKQEKLNQILSTDIDISHNKHKKYLINEGDNVPIMQELGIFTKENKIINQMYDKFKQINRFVEIIDDEFKNSNLKEITILDFGCGKSYLTFLIYHYFVNIKKIKANIIGYDIKKEVVENCNNLAKKYNCTGLNFVVSDVKKDKLFEGKIDMVVTLHACDTATDYALNFAIKNKAKFIFSVPCCQHEINLSIKNGGDYDLLLKHGIIKERFSALLTDSFRAEILTACGYSVDMLEFVDFTHSPKNIMIRAKLTKSKFDEKIFENLKKIKQKYNFNQKLYDFFEKF